METSAPTTAAPAERRWPAWMFSLLFHLTATLLLGIIVQPVPRGAAEEPGRTAGIVLKRSSAEGDLYEGEEDRVDASESAPDQPSPETLMAALPSESSSDESAADLPRLPTTGPGAAAGGGPPSASAMTTGGGRAGSIDGDGQIRVSVFGVEGTGSKFVYLFDRSVSMEGPPLEAAKRQLIKSLWSLESIHQFHIIFFNTGTRAFDLTGGGRRIAFATDQNKQLAANFVMGVGAEGGTDRLTALRHALSFSPDVIFFLTDADYPMSPTELTEIARLNRRANSAICTIEFGNRTTAPGNNFLTELAAQSGGQYGYINATRLPR